MRILKNPINPTSRIAAVLHVMYLILLPLLVLGLVSRSFTTIALLVIILSKWRMFAVRPRYWLANVRSNLVDIIVGFSVVSFMDGSGEFQTTLVWGGLYALWLILIKPRSSTLMVGAQAFIAQGVGLVSLYTNHNQWPAGLLVLVTWLICFSSARHFLVAFEDEANRAVSHIWGLFGAQLALILSHWQLVYYNSIPQIALVLSVVGYGSAVGYYLHQNKGLQANARKQLIVFVVILLLLILLQSDWQAQTF